MARLVIFDDRLWGVDLPARPVLVGRSRRADLPINDELLSRKHCAVVPFEDRYRIFDLKSANGTFVNGARVERRDLAADDIVEIGGTVMVYLEGEAAPRSGGVPSLRNPVKARELIDRLQPAAASAGRPRYPLLEIPPPASSGDPEDDPLAEELASALEAERMPSEGAVELLEAYLLFEVVRRTARRSPRLRRGLEAAVQGLIEHWRRSPPAGSDLRQQVRARLAAGGREPEDGGEREHGAEGAPDPRTPSP